MNRPESVDADLVAMIESLISSHAATAATVETGMDRELWTKLEAVGLTCLTRAEAIGGSGATWHEAAALISAAARHAAAVPLVEHDLLAGWVLGQTGTPCSPSTVLTIALLDATGTAGGVPWAGHTDQIALVYPDGPDWRVDVLATADVEVTPALAALGGPVGLVRVDTAKLSGTSLEPETVEQLFLRAALARSVQTCAALEKILALTVSHLCERVQFGRPLSRFQVLQHLVADMAAEVTLSRAATDAALSEAVKTDFSSPTLELAVATARSCVGHAVSVVVRAAHQAHGAIGTTKEHQLHRFTNAALAWRSEYGGVAYWDDVLAEAASVAGHDGAWSLIADGVELTAPLPA